MPSTSDLAVVTVFADNAVAAEVEATSLFLSGRTAAAAEAAARSIPCILVACDGTVEIAGGLA